MCSSTVKAQMKKQIDSQCQMTLSSMRNLRPPVLLATGSLEMDSPFLFRISTWIGPVTDTPQRIWHVMRQRGRQVGERVGRPELTQWSADTLSCKVTPWIGFWPRHLQFSGQPERKRRQKHYYHNAQYDQYTNTSAYLKQYDPHLANSSSMFFLIVAAVACLSILKMGIVRTSSYSSFGCCGITDKHTNEERYIY